MPLPSLSEIDALHRRHAPDPGIHDIVRSHCAIVWEIAEALLDAAPFDADRELVRAGCLLHDIGVYRLKKDARGHFGRYYVTHGIEGAALLREEEVDPRLVDITERHIGVGILATDVDTQELPIPRRDYLPRTPEERLVLYADKFHSKDPVFHSFEAYAKHLARFGEMHIARFEGLRSEFGLPDVRSLAARHGQPVD